MRIGIDTDTHIIYEGASEYRGRRVVPTPVVSPCKIVIGTNEEFIGPDSRSGPITHMFREDHFDPVTRIRRGRLYQAGDMQPCDWRDELGGECRADTYHHHSIWWTLQENRSENIYLLMGDRERFTAWRIIDLEVIASGEELVTIKSIRSFGMLPRMIDSEIMSKSISDALSTVEDDIHIASPESIVDRCRDAASAILGQYLNEPTEDLGPLVRTLGNKKKRIAHSAAKMINDFHPRVKPNEKIKHGIRPLSEEDAALSVSCLGAVLVELGLAEW